MPNEQHDRDDVDPQHFLDAICEAAPQVRARTQEILTDLARARIFFYPACGFDWNPLHRFTHMCDTFVYCDYGMKDDDFNNYSESIRNGVAPGIGLEVGEISYLDTEQVIALATPEAEWANDYPTVGEPWGKVIQLKRHIGNLTRDIRLLYFRAEGVTLFRNLFNKRSISPRMVCLKQCQDGLGGQNWTTFLNWNGPLGRAIWENPLRPEFVVSAYDRNPEPANRDPQGHRFDWPWSRVWQHHRDWHFREPSVPIASYVLENSLPASAGTPTQFHGILDRKVRMKPTAERTIVRLKSARHPNIPAEARQFSLGREAGGRSLEQALKQLRITCNQEGIQDAHAIGCHFEDEASALYEWKWKGSQPKTLTIHCESEGDLACYGPAADEVVD